MTYQSHPHIHLSHWRPTPVRSGLVSDVCTRAFMHVCATCVCVCVRACVRAGYSRTCPSDQSIMMPIPSRRRSSNRRCLFLVVHAVLVLSLILVGTIDSVRAAVPPVFRTINGRRSTSTSITVSRRQRWNDESCLSRSCGDSMHDIGPRMKASGIVSRATGWNRLGAVLNAYQSHTHTMDVHTRSWYKSFQMCTI